MRSQLERIAYIEKYLLQELSPEEMKKAKEEIESSSELTEMMERQQLIMQAARRKALREEINRYAPSSGSSFGRFGNWILGISLLIGIVGIIIGVFSQSSKLDSERSTFSPMVPAMADNTREFYEQPVAQKRDREMEGHKSYQRPYADKIAMDEDGFKSWLPLKHQYFNLNTKTGGVFEGDDGTVVVVPENALLDKNGNIVTGNVEMVLIEALNWEDMVAYNLSTVSGKDPLSSGGMLKVEFNRNGEELSVNPKTPLHIEVPTEDYNAKMRVWEGVQKEGRLDWQNPKRMESYLTPIDLDLLNFIPNGFENTVEEILPFNGHRYSTESLVDSLYYSLTDVGGLDDLEKFVYRGRTENRGFVRVEGIARTRGGRVVKNCRIQDAKVMVHRGDSLLARATTNGTGYFMVDMDKVGTDWVTVSVKIPNRKMRRKKVKFRKWPATSIVFELTLTEEELKAPDLLFRRSTPSNAEELYCFIDPLTVKVLKTNPFQETFIATKEFEERLQALHKTRQGKGLISVYMDNLDLPLWKCDKKISKALKGQEALVFNEFASHQLTNVRNSSLHLSKLKMYYNEKRKEYAKALIKRKMDRRKKKVQELADFQSELISDYETAIEDDIFKYNAAKMNTYKFTWNSTTWINLDFPCEGNLVDAMVNISIKDEPMDVTVYQCVRSLKSMVPLRKADGAYGARFPDELAPFNTYCIAISRDDRGILYGEARYSTDTKDDVEMEMSSVTEKELYGKIMALSPSNTKLVGRLKKEVEFYKEHLDILRKKRAFNDKMKDVLEEIEQEKAAMRHLRNSINHCPDVEAVVI